MRKILPLIIILSTLPDFLQAAGPSLGWTNAVKQATEELYEKRKHERPNNPPNTPGSLSPSDGATGQSVTVDLSWTGGDPDTGDTVTYDVYFEANDSNPDVLVSNDQSGTTYDPGTLSYDTHYYWKIIATDNHGASTTGPVWDFYTGSAANNPPNTPSSPSPADGATGQSINVDLSWTGGDPDTGDTVTYDVYFEANDSNPDVLVSNDQSATTYDPGTLSGNTHYYWQIIATDNHGSSTTGPVWDFTTGSAANNPPNTPGSPSPADGATDQSVTVDLSWTGGDPDTGDTVTYDVYFGTNPAANQLVSNNQSATTYDPGTLSYDTHYYWQIIATDNHGSSTTGPVWDFITGPAPIQQEMVLIPAGNFTMGSDLGYGDEKPVHTVYLDAYYIDKYEVTNAMYKQFIDAGGYNNSSYWTTDGWNWKTSNSITQPGYWTNTTFGYGSRRENLPVVGVSWYEAYAYAQWAGKRLPTEAEWEKAARGTDARTYPWGEGIDSTKANYNQNIGHTTDVGGYEDGKSPYGCYDMAGNVWEWCNDWYQSDYYTVSPTNNPQGPGWGSDRVVRGGSWGHFAGDCRSAGRNWYGPGRRDFVVGFRCARE